MSSVNLFGADWTYLIHHAFLPQTSKLDPYYCQHRVSGQHRLALVLGRAQLIPLLLPYGVPGIQPQPLSTLTRWEGRECQRDLELRPG
jgi:hypothetical protein